MGLGSDPAWGAGGHFSCDSYFGNTSDVGGGMGAPTVQVPGHAWAPRPFQFHHVVTTYTGAPNNTESVYIDGQLTYQNTNRLLGIVQGGNIYVGAWNNGGTIFGGNVAIAQLRMHDGPLTTAQVQYNFLSDAPAYDVTPTPSHTSTSSPSSTQIASLSSSPTTTPSPSGSACPTSFGYTHTLQTHSITASNDPTQYIRHACYYLWATSNYP